MQNLKESKKRIQRDTSHTFSMTNNNFRRNNLSMKKGLDCHESANADSRNDDLILSLQTPPSSLRGSATTEAIH